MKHYDVLIIGGGPAGASCAASLIKSGKKCLVLDKEVFPRQKICAGWLTPRVFRDLELKIEDYPYDLTRFSSLKIYLAGWPVIYPGPQFAIRRIEFDDWLLKRSGAEVLNHEVKNIRRSEKGYLIEDSFSAEYLIGAGGTHCPVRRLFFKEHPVRTGSQIISLEEEYRENWQDSNCRLWFFRDRLPGYAWYVPKKGGYLNIGIGASAATLKERGTTIREHWDNHTSHLLNLGLVNKRSYDPLGYTYFLRGSEMAAYKEKAYLVGDSAGLATLDMGEGIGPAIQSGIEAARSIVENQPYNLEGIPRFSLLPKALRWIF